MTSNRATTQRSATEVDGSQLATSRARVYGSLSVACSRPPDEELLHFLSTWSSLPSASGRTTLPATMKRGLRHLRAWLGSNGSSKLGLTSVEFVRLFRGLSPSHSPPPPYESVYLDRGLVCGPSTQEVAEFYRRFGCRSENNEPPDHIALELDFMRLLCQREALARESGCGAGALIKEERAFLNEHLARWASAFCENIRKFDSTGFYAGLADVAEGWIRCDQAFIRLLSDDGAKSESEARQPTCA